MKKNSTLMNKIVAVLLLIGSFIVMICEKEGTSFALICAAAAGTVACIVGIQALNQKQQASLVAMYGVAAKALNKYDGNSKFASILSSAVQAVRSYYSQFQSAGSYLAAGVANGISANTNVVTSAARSMAGSAAIASARRLEERSPSKVGYQIGDYFGIGFANGITDNIRNAEVTSEQLADSATAGLTNAASKIAAVINSDMDTTPTIRPVLDLTEIQNGAAAMANLINSLSGRPVEGTVSIAARTANSMSHPVASDTPATNASDVKNTENNVNNFYITGTDPRAIAEEVDRKLQRKVERKRAAWA